MKPNKKCNTIDMMPVVDSGLYEQNVPLTAADSTTTGPVLLFMIHRLTLMGLVQYQN